MNREIKFRGKNSKSEWIIGDLLRNRGETFIAPDGTANPLATADDFKVDPATVGQFTELRDKNGKEIYEGDILRCSDESIMSVHWDEQYLEYFVMDKEGNSNPMSCVYSDSEVIGNIHDHPDLIQNQ